MLSTASFLIASCNITSKTQAISSANYEQGNSLSVSITSTACAVQSIRAFEMSQASREAGAQEFDVYFPAGTTVGVGDRLTTFTNTFLGSGDVLEVISPAIDDAGEQAYIRVVARLVRGGGVK